MAFQSQAPTWVTAHLCPAIGVCLNQIMWSLPFPHVTEAYKKMDFGQTNTVPYLAMLFTNSGWCMYGIVRKDYYIFCSSILGISAGAYYSLMSIIIYASNNDLKSAKEHVHAIIGTSLFWSAIALIAGIILTKNSLERYDATLVVGILCDIASIAYYTAPLSTLFKVIRTHDSSSLDLPTILLNSTNNLMWSIYGIIAINNPLVWIPSVIGLLLGGFQVFVIFTYHAKRVVVHISKKISEHSQRFFASRSRSESAAPYNPELVDKQVYESLHIHKNTNAPPMEEYHADMEKERTRTLSFAPTPENV